VKFNERPGVNAAWRVSFASQPPWPRTIHGERHMNNLLGFLSVVFVLVIGTHNGWTQQKDVPHHDQSVAPTGTYAPVSKPRTPDPFSLLPSNNIPVFTLRLETNGTYFAQTAIEQRTELDGDLVRLRPHSEIAIGTWRWDKQKREFQLEPGEFTFYIKSLPVDKQHPDRLVWGSSWLVRNERK